MKIRHWEHTRESCRDGFTVPHQVSEHILSACCVPGTADHSVVPQLGSCKDLACTEALGTGCPPPWAPSCPRTRRTGRPRRGWGLGPCPPLQRVSEGRGPSTACCPRSPLRQVRRSPVVLRRVQMSDWSVHSVRETESEQGQLAACPRWGPGKTGSMVVRRWLECPVSLGLRVSGILITVHRMDGPWRSAGVGARSWPQRSVPVCTMGLGWLGEGHPRPSQCSLSAPASPLRPPWWSLESSHPVVLGSFPGVWRGLRRGRVGSLVGGGHADAATPPLPTENRLHGSPGPGHHGAPGR